MLIGACDPPKIPPNPLLCPNWGFRCALDRDYKDSIIGDGDVLISSTDAGRTFSIGKNSYVSKPQPPALPAPSAQPTAASASPQLGRAHAAAAAAAAIPNGLAPPSPPVLPAGERSAQFWLEPYGNLTSIAAYTAVWWPWKPNKVKRPELEHPMAA